MTGMVVEGVGIEAEGAAVNRPGVEYAVVLEGMVAVEAGRSSCSAEGRKMMWEVEVGVL